MECYSPMQINYNDTLKWEETIHVLQIAAKWLQCQPLADLYAEVEIKIYW